MKKLSLILAVLLAACTPYMYGVPQETWDKMSEPERVAAIHAHEQEQQARRQAAEERARRQAVEEERERVRQAALELERQQRIEAIHRGEGAFGELIRVRLQGGEVKVGRRYYRYEPLTFTIADREAFEIPVIDRKGRETGLQVAYVGGEFLVDGVRFPYDRHWSRGRLYTGTAGKSAFHLVDVFVQVHEHSSRAEREPQVLLLREVSVRENSGQR